MKEQVSALFDGGVDADGADPVFRSLLSEGEMRAQWRAYGLIGDALRGEDNLDRDLTESIMLRLADEPTVLAPSRSLPARRWSRSLMPIAASIFGLAVVGVVAQSLRQSGNEELNVASAPMVQKVAVLPVSAKVPPEVQRARDEAIQAYLVAHQGFSPSSGMQGVAPYVRMVSEEGLGEGR